MRSFALHTLTRLCVYVYAMRSILARILTILYIYMLIIVLILFFIYLYANALLLHYSKLNFSDYASRIVHPLVRCLEIPDARSDTMEALCGLAFQV